MTITVCMTVQRRIQNFKKWGSRKNKSFVRKVLHPAPLISGPSPIIAWTITATLVDPYITCLPRLVNVITFVHWSELTHLLLCSWTQRVSDKSESSDINT